MNQGQICMSTERLIADEAQTPFGGVRDSDHRRFGGKAAIDAFAELRWIAIEDPGQRYPFQDRRRPRENVNRLPAGRWRRCR